MKDHTDSQTIDYLESLNSDQWNAFCEGVQQEQAEKKKRGRPPTGNAKTAAQRMAEKRARDKAVYNRARCQADYSEVSTSGLLELMATAVRDQMESNAKKIAAELVKRSKFKE